eukprot:scaffold1579_cov165-Amphora_coffeaeformis.AAC.3
MHGGERRFRVVGWRGMSSLLLIEYQTPHFNSTFRWCRVVTLLICMCVTPSRRSSATSTLVARALYYPLWCAVAVKYPGRRADCAGFG